MFVLQKVSAEFCNVLPQISFRADGTLKRAGLLLVICELVKLKMMFGFENFRTSFTADLLAVNGVSIHVPKQKHSFIKG